MKKLSTNFHGSYKLFLLCSVFFIVNSSRISAQTIDSIVNKIDPEKLGTTIEKKFSGLEEKIVEKSEKTLRRMQQEEEKVYKKMLASKDSVTAKLQLDDIRNGYASLKDKLRNPIQVRSVNAIKEYVPHLDSLTTALKFLDNESLTGNVKNALSKVESFQGRLQQADEIKKFIKERREQIKQVWEKLGIAKNFKKINKEVYYYSEQIKEYKAILKDPKKIEKKAIELLSETKVFQDFMKKNSMLASLFRMPGDLNDPNYVASLMGLQTRGQVNSLVQNRVGTGGQQVVQQNMQQAQSQLQQLKDKIREWSGGSSDDIMPNGFKPNSQKTKSFFRRLEYGTNFQAQRSHYMFPVTTDIGLSLGYKLNDRSTIGIGSSYKIGWGSGWDHLKITHQGVGFRSYIDWKIKGAWWISGGYEQNFKSEIKSFDQLKDISAWQQSGLIGISKVVSVKSKLFKKTKVQLLWDFLSYQQTPQAQPLVFRLGYNLK
jgi:hypothetical protein